MVGVVGEATVMPKQAEVTVMHAHFVDQLFAEEIRFLFGEVHIVLLAQRTIHDDERMEGEWREFIRRRIDPPYGAGGLQTKTGFVRKTHREIVRITRFDEVFEMTDGRPQVMGAIERADRTGGQELVVTPVYAEPRTAIQQECFETLEIPNATI